MVRAATLIFALMAATPTLSQHPVPTMFGMTAGEPIPYPECGKRPYTEMCKEPFGSPGGPWNEYFIHFPYGRAPEIVASNSISVKVAGNRIVAFRFQTLGIISQDHDIVVLSEKFGKPKSVTRLPLQTLAGGSVEAALAKWEVGDLSITLDSMGYGIEGGRVDIFTSAGRAINEKIEAEKKAKRVAF